MPVVVVVAAAAAAASGPRRRRDRISPLALALARRPRCCRRSQLVAGGGAADEFAPLARATSGPRRALDGRSSALETFTRAQLERHLETLRWDFISVLPPKMLASEHYAPVYARIEMALEGLVTDRTLMGVVHAKVEAGRPR